MPFKSTRLPKYRHYKPKDLAVVRIDGKDHYLGKFGSEESQQKYRRLIAEMLAAPATAQPPTPRPDGDGGPTINELLVSYCTNAWEFSRLFRDEKVYRPRFVRVRLAPAK